MQTSSVIYFAQIKINFVTIYDILSILKYIIKKRGLTNYYFCLLSSGTKSKKKNHKKIHKNKTIAYLEINLIFTYYT